MARGNLRKFKKTEEEIDKTKERDNRVKRKHRLEREWEKNHAVKDN